MALKLNPTTGKLDLVDLNDVYVGSGGYAANLYFTTIDSVVTGYKKFSYTVEPTETELIILATTVEVLARTYLFDGALATTSIDAGKWVASFRAKVSGTQGAYLRFEAFLYHADTTETTLFTATSDKIINTSYQTLSKESTQPIFTCATTDRLGCRIYAYTTHPAGITIKTIVGDGNASYFTTPLALRHSQLRDKNSEADVQHLTAAEKAQFGKIIHFGTVETAAATAAKEVTIADYVPAQGDILCLKYTLGTSASSPTLSINGGPATAIILGSTLASVVTHTVGANGEIKYCYDGTEWQMFGSMRTSDSNSMELDYMGVACKVGAETTRWKILMQGTDDKFYPLTIGNTTATTKTISTVEFKVGGLVIWYATTATLDADSSSLTMYTEYNSANFTYAINKAASSLTANTNLYLKGTINANGNFVLDNTTTTSAFVEALPTTDDGFIYMFLGYSYSTNAFKLMQQHPIYQFKDGKIQLYGASGGDFLKLDQSEPQTVLNGMPIFDGGLKVQGNVLSFYINLSPVVYNTTDYYLAGDAAALFYLSTTQDVQIIVDDGEDKLPILVAGLSTTQPTIYMYLITAPALDNAHVTCFSDLNEADFLAFIKNITEDPTTVIDYHETAFTYLGGVYTNVTTKPVCSPSENTTWTNPSVITTDYAGFTVNPTTSNIDHVGNYTNNVTTSIMKTKGQLKAGNGNLIDLITCPITSNPILDLSASGLQFAMTFVPEIISTGTIDTPVFKTVYASGVYGTTAFEGGYATYGGTALGMWSAVQNAISGATTLQEGVAVRGGMTYSSGNNSSMYVRDMICFQTGFTNLNNGTSTHDNIKHYEAGTIDTNKVTSCTNNYAFYSADNSAAATNSWGLYSLEPSNYAKGLSVDGIVKPLAPIQINLVTSGFARALRIVPQNNVLGYGGYIEFGVSSTANGYGPQIGGFRTGSGSGDFVIKTGGKAQKERVRVTDAGLVGIGMTPTELLDVNGNIKASGYKSSDGSEGQTTTVTVVTDTRMNSGQLQKKTQVLTYKNGLLTDKAAESDWTDTTDV